MSACCSAIDQQPGAPEKSDWDSDYEHTKPMSLAVETWKKMKQVHTQQSTLFPKFNFC
jgi:hypothetical protein